MKTQLLVASLALIFGAQAYAELNPQKVCVNNKTGAARFTGTLSGKKAECKKKESEEYYAGMQQVFDSAGTFVGYAYPDSSINPYNADVFVPSAGTTLWISPLVNMQTRQPGNLNVGIAVGYRAWKRFYYANKDCTGQQYIDNEDYGSNYRDPVTNVAYQEKGSPVLANPQSFQELWYDSATNTWPSYSTCQKLSIYATPGVFLISSPQALSLPFTTLQLPLVFGLLK
ncbi:MAG: hypothetical protein ACKN9W_03525 [Methylococcus sp.]